MARGGFESRCTLLPDLFIGDRPRSSGWATLVVSSTCVSIWTICSPGPVDVPRASADTCSRRRRVYIRKVPPLIDKLHYQAARWLAVRYDTVLLPVFFATSDMVICGGRKIRSKTVHHILTFVLFRFRQFLRWETWQYGKVVLNVNKSYASRTCSWSGEIIDSFGGRRTQTGSDGVYLDREINGARGNSLLVLGGTPYLCENVACLARMYRKWPYAELDSGQERCSEFE